VSRAYHLPLASLASGCWRGRQKVRFAHCDPAGIVYFARYFDMMNSAVEDWFVEALGLDYHDIIGRRRVGLGYARAETDFLRPSRMGDRLTFAILVERIGGASVNLRLHAYNDDEPALEGKLVMVSTSLETNRAIPVPPDIRARLEQYQELCGCP
jgi:4-hydroxybenzoyl-CoA thioesterase